LLKHPLLVLPARHELLILNFETAPREKAFLAQYMLLPNVSLLDFVLTLLLLRCVNGVATAPPALKRFVFIKRLRKFIIERLLAFLGPL
jgi:hypothetical protein